VKFRGMDSEFERDGPDDVEQGNDTHMRTVIPASSPEVRIMSVYLQSYLTSYNDCISQTN
jgi:hypothetical protein